MLGLTRASPQMQSHKGSLARSLAALASFALVAPNRGRRAERADR